MNILKKIIMPLLGLLLWELLAIWLNNPVIIPPVESVINVLMNPQTSVLGTGNLIENTIVSIKRVISGFIIAGIIGIPLGIFMGYFSTIMDLLEVL